MDEKHNLSVVQLNCHKSHAVMLNLKQNFSQSANLFLLQEPHVGKNGVSGLSGFNVCSFGENPRAAIAARNDLHVWPDPLYSDSDMTTIIVTKKHMKVYVSSIYLDICLLYTSPSPRDRG